MNNESKIEKDNRPLMVTINCITYNHEPYIRQCLEGFVMQKTNFRFEAIVHDDASTDGTAAIIREYAEKYPDIIKPIFETENQYSKGDGSLIQIMNAHTHGKYVAMCEGDDYWIDPYKLQKQVDFLENNSEYVLLHTGFKFFYQEYSTYQEYSNLIYYNNLSREEIIRAILDDNTYRIQTNTVLFRTSVYHELINANPFLYSGSFLMGDTQLWVNLLMYGKVQYLPQVTAVYRIVEGSACRSKTIEGRIRFILSCYEMRLCLCSYFHLRVGTLILKLWARYIKYLLIYLYFNIAYKPAYIPCHIVWIFCQGLMKISLIRGLISLNYRPKKYR